MKPIRAGLLLSLLLAAAPLPAQEIIAHRGFSAEAPENTLAAFTLAWQAGADGCELDLHLTSDQQIVVIHDKDTERTCGAKHLIAATPARVLTALDAGSWKHPQWHRERIPTLAEALATLPAGPQRFFLEVKCGPEVVPVLRDLLQPWQPRAAQLALISFNSEVCADAKKALPWLPVYQLASFKKSGSDRPAHLGSLITRARRDGLDGLNLSRDWPWSPAMVEEIRAAGLKALVWTVNDPAEARRFAELKLDGITTDDPVSIQRALNRS